jgi:sugar fermentation stimulation protein A
MVDQGHRAVLFFCVQHSGARVAGPATAIDPLYSATLAEAVAKGVEVLAYACELSAEEIAVARKIDFMLTPEAAG